MRRDLLRSQPCDGGIRPTWTGLRDTLCIVVLLLNRSAVKGRQYRWPTRLSSGAFAYGTLLLIALFNFLHLSV